MNAVSFVAYAGELVGMPAAQALRRAHEVLEYCKLGEARYRDVDTYSTGMKQRIKLAQAMVHGPKLLFLDEPTNGLDPEGRDEMLTLIRDITHGKDVNVVVSSHLLPDIERTCDRIVMMKAGRVAMQGEIAELRGSGSDQLDVELRELSPAFLTAIDAAGGSVIHSLGAKVRLTLPPGTANPGQALFAAARESGAQIRGFSTARRSLEDVFLEAVE
jgi:ABC-2 type transport system ATP-binding protein